MSPGVCCRASRARPARGHPGWRRRGRGRSAPPRFGCRWNRGLLRSGPGCGAEEERSPTNWRRDQSDSNLASSFGSAPVLDFDLAQPVPDLPAALWSKKSCQRLCAGRYKHTHTHQNSARIPPKQHRHTTRMWSLASRGAGIHLLQEAPVLGELLGEMGWQNESARELLLLLCRARGESHLTCGWC